MMAKRSHARRSNAIISRIPQKPDLEISDIEEFIIKGTNAPGFDDIRSAFQRIHCGTNVETPEEFGKYSAPVYAPERERLAINLVPSDLVYKLEEYRADNKIITSIFWACIGGIVGIMGNWLTSDPPHLTPISVVAVIMLLVFSTIFGFIMSATNQRAKKKKSEIDNYNKKELEDPL